MKQRDNETEKPRTVNKLEAQYDFSRGNRGRIAAPGPEPRGKARIAIRIDEDVVDHFLKEADASGGAAGCQTLINDALRQHVESKAPKLEETLRQSGNCQPLSRGQPARS